MIFITQSKDINVLPKNKNGEEGRGMERKGRKNEVCPPPPQKNPRYGPAKVSPGQ